MTPIEDQLSAGLHRLTDTLAPSADPADDLRRGRRRRNRTRLALGCGSVVVVASTAAVVTLVPGAERAPVAQDPTPTPTAPGTGQPTTPTTPTAAPATPRCVDADAGSGASGTFTPAAPDLLGSYRSILAERLDPTGRHLGPAGAGNQVGTSPDPACPAGQDRLTSYGTKLDWRVPGESGLGMVQVEVTDESSTQAQVWMAHETWRARPVDLPGVRSAEVAAYDGGVAVLVHRTDGMSVAIDASSLFGNNSRTPVSGVDLAVEDLLAAAADPRFTLS